MIHYQVPNLVARRLMYLETITVAYIRDAAIERKSSIILPVPHQGRKGENGR
jgi:hypothetical protein